MVSTLLMFAKLILRLVSYALVLVILVFAFSFARPYISHIEAYPYLAVPLNMQQKITQKVKVEINKVIPTNVAGFDITRILMIIVFLFVLGQVNGLRQRIHLKEAYEKYEEELKKIVRTTHLDDSNKAIDALKHDVEEMKHVSGKKRKELILHFMEVQHRLESFKRVLAFLSVDVVGSTAMKANEDPMAISADFYRYNELADKVLSENKCIKVAKTPDGIMAAFSDTDHAVMAGQQLITGLDHFNQFVKKMKMDFKVRCGINSGMLYFDPDEPLEHLSDRVIDIAGHMQKEAEPNTINIAKSSIAPLEKTSGFTNAEKVIDDEVVYTWKPK